MLITDSQIHLWQPHSAEHPWPDPPRGGYSRESQFSGEEAVAAMDAAGVDRAVIVPPVWAGEYNGYAQEVAARYPGRFAVMGRFDTDAPGGEDRLAGWLSQPHMLGIRVSFIAVPRPEQLDDGSIEWFWSACERLGIPLMVLFSGRAEKAAPIVERHPGLTIILDHMALPLGAERAAAWDALAYVLPLARFPNVYVKVSSAPNFSNEPFPHRDIHGHLRRLCDSFGPRRLFWGSDLTRLAGSYEHCLQLFRQELDFLTDDDKEWILGKGLARCLNWPADAAGTHAG